MTKPKLVKFTVELELPEGVSMTELKGYIEDAVSSWKGSFEPPNAYGDGSPGDPLFSLNGDSVRVAFFRKPKRG